MKQSPHPFIYIIIIVLAFMGWIAFFTEIVSTPQDSLAEGRAKAQFLLTHHGIDVTPEVAQYLNVSVHLTDVVISPAEINVWEPQAGWESYVPTQDSTIVVKK